MGFVLSVDRFVQNIFFFALLAAPAEVATLRYADGLRNYKKISAK